MSSSIASRPLSVDSSVVARGQFEALADGQSRVDFAGGKKSAGIIRGVSLISRGEALGHGVWADKHFVQQAVDFANKHERGLKSRFKHPSMSADGTGNYLGRFHDARLSSDGTQAYADLHLDPAAHEAPNGDLANYVMRLAESDPAAFGMSIVFQYDGKAMNEFLAANTKETVDVIDGQQKTAKRFKSPDELNTKNLPHARMAALRAADAVDSPAANPNGLFGDPEGIVTEAEQLMSFVTGVSDERPALAHFDADPDRLKQFFAKWLDNSKLSLVKRAELTPAEFAAQLARYKEQFGAELGCELIARGATWEQALAEWGGLLRTQLVAAHASLESAQAEHAKALAAATDEIALLKKRMTELPLGEKQPLSVGGGTAAPKPASLSDGIAVYVAGTKIPAGPPDKAA